MIKFEPLRAVIKGTKSDADGEWTITLAIPQSDAGKAAQLSLYKKIVFLVQFTPESTEELEESI